MFVFFFILVLLVPITMIVLGLLWRKRPPKTINMVSGYRTAWSMKSQNTWNFAHKYAGLIWLFIGFPLCILSVVIICFFRDYNINELGEIVIIITIVQIVSFLFPILPTEVALRKRFDENGNKKDC